MFQIDEMKANFKRVALILAVIQAALFSGCSLGENFRAGHDKESSASADLLIAQWYIQQENAMLPLENLMGIQVANICYKYSPREVIQKQRQATAMFDAHGFGRTQAGKNALKIWRNEEVIAANFLRKAFGARPISAHKYSNDQLLDIQEECLEIEHRH